MDNCISVFHKEQKDKLYRIYVTDTLMMMTENTAKMSQQGSYLKERFINILEPPSEDEIVDEEKEAEEVISNIMEKLRKV